MEINLLPEIPKTKRYQWLIVILAGLVVLGLSTLAGIHIWQKSQALTEKTELLEQLKKNREQKMELLNKSKTEIEIFTVYLNNYNNLINSHVNYVPFVDDFSQYLPEDGKLLMISWLEDGIVQLTGEFTSMDLIAKYVQFLNQLTWVDDVNVSYIQQIENIEQSTVFEQENQSDSDSNQTAEEQEITVFYTYQFMLEIKVDLLTFYQLGGGR